MSRQIYRDCGIEMTNQAGLNQKSKTLSNFYGPQKAPKSLANGV